MGVLAIFKLNHGGRFNYLMPFLFCCSFGALAQPKVALEADMQNCQYLDQIKGGSGYGKNFNWQALAKHSAFRQAEKLAATHVVWVRFDPVGGFNGVAIAKAYHCNQRG